MKLIEQVNETGLRITRSFFLTRSFEKFQTEIGLGKGMRLRAVRNK